MFPRNSVRRPSLSTASVRVLESLESRLTPANTTSTTTYIHEVVTNRPVEAELFATRILAPDGTGGFGFDRTISITYDPADPTIAAAVTDAIASAAAAYPTRTIEVITSSTILLGGTVGDFPRRSYPHTFRILTDHDTTQQVVGTADSVQSIETIVTNGPATVPTGANGSLPLFVPAGDVHTNSITHFRRDIATTTTQTFTTTQFVLVTPVFPSGVGGGVTSFSVSSRTKQAFALESVAAANRETNVTRIVGTFNGLKFDETLNVPYDAANPAIRDAIAAARSAVSGSGARSTSIAVGNPIRARIGSDESSSDRTETTEYEVAGFDPVTTPGGVYQVAPPVPGETSTDPSGPAIDYIGSAVILIGEETSQLFFVADGDDNLDIFSERIQTTTRTRMVMESFMTTTTIQIIGGDHVHLRAVGADAGGGPHVRAFTVDGEVAFNRFVYEPTFTGGVRVATGDVTGDGVDDILTAAGDGGGPRIQIFDGATGELFRNFMAFPDTLRVGVFVSAADINNDGYADYAVTPGFGGGPRVALFDGRTGERIGNDFLAFDEADRNGITVALNETGIAVGQFVGGSQVRTFDLSGNPIAGFTAFEGFSGGVNLAFDPIGTLLVGAGPGGGPLVRKVNSEGTVLESKLVGSESDRGGVRVGTVETPLGATVVTAVGGEIRSESGEFFPAFDGALGFAVWVS